MPNRQPSSRRSPLPELGKQLLPRNDISYDAFWPQEGHSGDWSCSELRTACSAMERARNT